MKALKTGLAICFFLAGCTRSHNIEFEGYFTYGHEVSSFKMCNDSKEYWISGEGLEVIRQASLSLADVRNKPYQPVYVKFSGFFDSREAVGFAEDYDGLIYLDKLLTYSEQSSVGCE